MLKTIRLTALLLSGTGLLPAARAAEPPGPGEPAVAVLGNAEAWKQLPPAEKGGGQPLPSWARALAGVMPRSTAALLRVDFVQRARSPLDPKLRAEMRWVAADANRCRYTAAYALYDVRRAGLDEAAVAALCQGDYSREVLATRAALEFARKMTLNSASVTDAEFAALVKQYGEKDVAAMVLLAAWANFQDRLVLSLGSTLEPDGPLPPLDVVFAPGQLVTRQPAAQRGNAPPRQNAPISPGAGKDLVEDDSGWTNVPYEELQARLERQRIRSTRVRVPSWDEVERVLPPDFMWPNKVVWNLVCLGYQPDLGGAWETYLRTSSIETADGLNRVFGSSLFWVTTRSVNCAYCMGHCEFSLENAGLSKPEIAERTRRLASGEWSTFPADEQRAYDFARKLTDTPWAVSAENVQGLLQDFGPKRGLMVIVAACRGHYMTRVSNGFQLSLERENVFRHWGPATLAQDPAAPKASGR